MKSKMPSQSDPAPMMTLVKSSNIAAIGHDPGTNTLHVQFSNGSTYAYDSVSPEDHAAFVSAESAGSHFAKNIRPKFEGRKLYAVSGLHSSALKPDLSGNGEMKTITDARAGEPIVPGMAAAIAVYRQHGES
jgi:hypothetical protein